MRGPKPKSIVTPDDAHGVLPAPDFLSADGKAEWARVMPILADRKILTDADLGSLENYCIAIGQTRETERLLQQYGSVIVDDEGGMKRNPAVGIQSDAMTRSRLLAAELGLTPVSRSRPSVREDASDDNALLG